MIQEKDFLYRVPVKTAPITTPGGQIRNPEILVDLQGGEFMRGNILDANSTNKLVNQSVKEAVDNKIIEGGYVTKDLLEAETTRATEQENSLKTLIDAETSARTKGDEDLSSKIKAEQNRAEGKEKEISDKLAIVNCDSNTEGSFRKAIADVVAAAPEDLDTLKEIADKLADNDDLHTALNQAITEKADASALLNEVTRATGAESGLQAAIATKADATALSNYVLTTALNQQVDTLNAAISAKQDAGNYIPYKNMQSYGMNNYNLYVANKGDAILFNGKEIGDIYADTLIDIEGVSVKDNINSVQITKKKISGYVYDDESSLFSFSLSGQGVRLSEGDNNHVLTSNASTIDITQYALKSQLNTKADTTALTALEQKVTANTTAIAGKQDKGNYVTYIRDDGSKYTLQKGLNVGNKVGNQLTIGHDSIICTAGDGFVLDGTGLTFNGRLGMEIPTAGGGFIRVSDLASAEDISSLQVGLSKKQDKIKANSVDVTNLTHANIDQLINIVQELLIALDSSGLIIMEDSLE